MYLWLCICLNNFQCFFCSPGQTFITKTSPKAGRHYDGNAPVVVTKQQQNNLKKKNTTTVKYRCYGNRKRKPSLAVNNGTCVSLAYFAASVWLALLETPSWTASCLPLLSLFLSRKTVRVERPDQNNGNASKQHTHTLRQRSPSALPVALCFSLQPIPGPCFGKWKIPYAFVLYTESKKDVYLRSTTNRRA